MIASPPLTPLLVFLVAYAGFIALPRHRAALACGASGLLLLAGFSTWRAAIQEHIAWNVLGLLTGMMVMAELFNLSRMPAVIAEHIARRCGNAFTALLLIIGIAAAFSTFLDNVSVVLLLAPVALGITRRLKISPVRTLMCIAVAANLEGTATLIGDPPSMLMAGHLKLSFNDFFFYKGKPGIFWAVQAGALASLAVVAWLLRDTRRPIHFEDVETVRSWVPTALLVALIGCLSLASRVDPGFVWLAGTATLGFALAGAAWYLGVARWGHVRELLHGIDFRTLGFLLGMLC